MYRNLNRNCMFRNAASGQIVWCILRFHGSFCQSSFITGWEAQHSSATLFLYISDRTATIILLFTRFLGEGPHQKEAMQCLDYRPRSAFRPSLAQGLGHDLRSDGSGKGLAVPPGMAGVVQLRNTAAWAALAASTPNSRARSSLYSLPVPSLRTLQPHPTLPPPLLPRSSKPEIIILMGEL